MRLLFILLFTVTLAQATTPFLLTKLPSVYPLVEIYSKHVPKKYIAIIKKEIVKMTNELHIKNDGFSGRPLTFFITDLSIDDKKVVKVALMMGEEVKRLDDGEVVFAFTYLNVDIVEVEDDDEEEFDIMESIDFLLEEFKDQYKEDNE